jgi:hypothetical protein
MDEGFVVEQRRPGHVDLAAARQRLFAAELRGLALIDGVEAPAQRVELRRAEAARDERESAKPKLLRMQIGRVFFGRGDHSVGEYGVPAHARSPSQRATPKPVAPWRLPLKKR